MADTYQWLGSSVRRTFWRVGTDGAVCLGRIVPEGDGWAVWATVIMPDETHDVCRLRWLDDAEAAARTMCAHWRVPYVALKASDAEEVRDAE